MRANGPPRKSKRVPPASQIVRKLGGEAVVAGIIRSAASTPYRWQDPVKRGGTGGNIPQKHWPALMAYAREHNIQLELKDFSKAPLRKL